MDAFKKLFHDGLAYIPREKGGGYDQIALMRYIWPWGKKVALSHGKSMNWGNGILLPKLL